MMISNITSASITLDAYNIKALDTDRGYTMAVYLNGWSGYSNDLDNVNLEVIFEGAAS